MANSVNRIVAVPNWSFYDPDLSRQASELLAGLGVRVHYCQGDIDHQRTVTAFSGPQADVFAAALELARFLLPHIDLRRQSGVHPRIGAMDVMPFVLIEGSEPELIDSCRSWAARFRSEFDVPFHLYEKAALEGREYQLPYLRGQMSGVLVPVELEGVDHPQWGTSIIGVRDFLLATNINVDLSNVGIVKQVAREIRDAREEGNPDLAGVRSLGFELQSRQLTQLSLNLTTPDLTTFDRVHAFSETRLNDLGAKIVETELIGVIRERDLSGATHLTIDPRQVVR